ncbi:MAG: hypothetical protein ACOYXT_06850 [Bacteroidota bacterium]
MKTFFRLAIVAVAGITGFAPIQGDNIEFSCLKTHKATNTCHFNFKVDGAKYRFVDIGCKYSKKKEEVIKKAKEGTLALARDWKIECPESKDEKKDSNGF